MALLNIEELSKELIRLELVEPLRIDECRSSLTPNQQDSASLLKALENRQLLTSYQIKRIRKNEFDGLVLGDYKVLYQNASGSFARVFRACALADNEMIGLKVLRQRWANEPMFVSEFHREAELLKVLRHPNIVPIYDVFTSGKYHFFTMEFIEGGNLREFIRIRKKMAPVEATRFILDMAYGLEYALGQGVTHRDLKMTNVLISSSGVAKLVDFGLASCTEISGISGLVGVADGVQRALEYAALEKGTGAPENDPRSDLYFLGAIYYELLTGVSPYPRTRNRDERRNIARYKNIRPIRAHDPNIPYRVVDVVERLMHINPDHRYQTPSLLIGELEAICPQLESAALENVQKSSVAEAKKDENINGSQPVVLCVENRHKQQDLLRKYLTKHGYRVLMLNETSRAINRLKTNPPDCVVFMGESIGDDILSAFELSTSIGKENSLITFVLLGKKQGNLAPQFETSDTARVLLQPVKLRDLNRELKKALKRRDEIQSSSS